MIRRAILSVRTITPVHIGSGRNLVEDFDFVAKDGRTIRILEEGLIDRLYARDPKLTDQLMRTPPGQLLKSEDLREGSPLIRYVLPGEPSGQEFREAIKDPHDRPYIPGSSLKGALRTVLAWHAWKELDLSLARVRLGNKEKNAAQDLEAEIFGRDPKRGRKSPHHDLLRALRVADSDPVGTEKLAIYQVKVWTHKGGAAPISMEAIKPGTELQLEVSIDQSLFSDWASKAPGFPFKHYECLSDISKLARARANERLRNEFVFWKDAGFKELPFQLLDHINELQKTKQGFPLQLGFGTGWEGTTIGAPLKEDPEWPKVYLRYPMGINPKTKRRTPPEEYPRSRRVVVNRHGKPVAPLGWVWISWKEAR